MTRSCRSLSPCKAPESSPNCDRRNELPIASGLKKRQAQNSKSQSGIAPDRLKENQIADFIVSCSCMTAVDWTWPRVQLFSPHFRLPYTCHSITRQSVSSDPRRLEPSCLRICEAWSLRPLRATTFILEAQSRRSTVNDWDEARPAQRPRSKS